MGLGLDVLEFGIVIGDVMRGFVDKQFFFGNRADGGDGTLEEVFVARGAGVARVGYGAGVSADAGTDNVVGLIKVGRFGTLQRKTHDLLPERRKCRASCGTRSRRRDNYKTGSR